MSLVEYRKKRRFKKTPEPKGGRPKKGDAPSFVIQKHHARNLHYDLRLEIRGTLKSWAVPKGPPKKIGDKRLAIQTENHPLEYAKFEGVIPKGEYGAGTVKIYDSGTFENIKTDPLSTCLKKGALEFRLNGKKLKSTYALVHFKEKNWLWIKVRAKK